MELSDLSKDERSLLLYIETCAVDNGGLVNNHRINEMEVKILKDWDTQNFISFSRITWKSILLLAEGRNNTHLVKLSDEAWRLAHQERRARSIRMSQKSPYCDLITTKEKRGEE